MRWLLGVVLLVELLPVPLSAQRLAPVAVRVPAHERSFSLGATQTLTVADTLTQRHGSRLHHVMEGALLGGLFGAVTGYTYGAIDDANHPDSELKNFGKSVGPVIFGVLGLTLGGLVGMVWDAD